MSSSNCVLEKMAPPFPDRGDVTAHVSNKLLLSATPPPPSAYRPPPAAEAKLCRNRLATMVERGSVLNGGGPLAQNAPPLAAELFTNSICIARTVPRDCVAM